MYRWAWHTWMSKQWAWHILSSVLSMSLSLTGVAGLQHCICLYYRSAKFCHCVLTSEIKFSVDYSSSLIITQILQCILHIKSTTRSCSNLALSLYFLSDFFSVFLTADSHSHNAPIFSIFPNFFSVVQERFFTFYPRFDQALKLSFFLCKSNDFIVNFQISRSRDVNMATPFSKLFQLFDSFVLRILH